MSKSDIIAKDFNQSSCSCGTLFRHASHMFSMYDMFQLSWWSMVLCNRNEIWWLLKEVPVKYLILNEGLFFTCVSVLALFYSSRCVLDCCCCCSCKNLMFSVQKCKVLKVKPLQRKHCNQLIISYYYIMASSTLLHIIAELKCIYV